MRTLARLLLGCALLLSACSSSDDSGGSPDAKLAPDANLGPDGDPRPVVVISTTMGDMVVRLEDQLMPNTTANFLSYVDESWYDGTLFHRVIDDFMIQGGGFTSGMAQKTPHSPIDFETSTQVTHVNGAISMARTNDPNSATSQFFIVDCPTSPCNAASLDGQYAAFGVLIEGFDVLASISGVPTHTVGQFGDVPVTDIVINSATRR